MKIFTVIGARPQFIKAAVVSRAFKEHRPDVREVLVHTGQHYDANMSDVFFNELDIPHPDHNLGVGGGTHGQNTGRMLEKLEALMQAERPDWVLVYGDTDSTLAGALAASKLHIPVAHVEAGLRSFNRNMPEEINRVLTDHIASLLFTPTEKAQSNLQNEGISSPHVVPVGDVMYDAALYFSAKLGVENNILENLSVPRGNYILATVHRAENTDSTENLSCILKALTLAAERWHVIWPLHPRTRNALNIRGQIKNLPPQLKLIDPVGYLNMVQLEKHAALIATDSGGVQKEAFFHGIPCITLRNETEWMELVESGWNRLTPPNSASFILDAINKSIGTRGKNIYPYGMGDASKKIAECLFFSRA